MLTMLWAEPPPPPRRGRSPTKTPGICARSGCEKPARTLKHGSMCAEHAQEKARLQREARAAATTCATSGCGLSLKPGHKSACERHATEMSIRVRRRQLRLIAKRKCLGCGRAKPVRAQRCEACAIRHDETHKACRERKYERGICERCSRPVASMEPGTTARRLCLFHLPAGTALRLGLAAK